LLLKPVYGGVRGTGPSFYLASDAGLWWDPGHRPQVITSPLKPVYDEVRGTGPSYYLTSEADLQWGQGHRPKLLPCL